MLVIKKHKKAKKSRLYINTFRVIGTVILLYIAYKYFYSDLRFKDLIQSSTSLFERSSILPLLAILILMPINWLFESMKWQETMKPQLKLSIKEAYIAVFQGISFGIITPARVGEYGGRILYLNPEHRLSGIVSTFVCSLYQNIINILMASIFIIFTNLEFVQEYNKGLIVGCGFFLCVFVSIIILGLPKIISYVSRFPFFQKKVKNINELPQQLKRINNSNVFTYSLLRYIVYCFQYLLIFEIFHISLSPQETFLAIGIIYGIQTILPLTPLLQIGLRGSIAVFVLSSIPDEKNMVILASYSLWLINLLIPSMIGGILMLLKSSDKRQD